MGAWNYGTSDVITVAYYDIAYYPSDEEIEDKIRECDGGSREGAIEILQEEHNFSVQEDKNFVERYLSELNLYYYTVQIEDGYYEGFQIVIERIYTGLSWKERQEMQKELTQIKKDLITVIENNMMRVCYPGWCIGWKDTIDESLKALKEAIKEERKVINSLKIEK